MIVYFADRQLNIIGQASTELPDGCVVSGDKKTGDVETGVSTFECDITFDKKTRSLVEQCTQVGNYILRNHNGENELYTIIEAEINTKKQEVYIYAEDDGMDLLNEVVGAYTADKAYPIDHYINKYVAGAGFVIGINEAKGLTRELSWDGESTATERVASIATQFDGCEISFSFDVDGLYVVKKYINIYKERGKDIGVTLRLNQDIDSIVTTKSIANIATALQCTGGTPEDDNLEDDVEPTAITLSGYEYDDGDFYVDGILLKSRQALQRWSRFLWKTEDSQKSGGHIVKQYSYDTLNQATLCARAITELKKIRDMEINYEVDITKFPDNVKIGDRINIVDDTGEMYVSARVLKLEQSVSDQEHKATLGEYLIQGSGIHQKVAELAEQFAKNSVSAKRALAIANNAKAEAGKAQGQANAAVQSTQAAQQAAEAAQQAANSASDSASIAQQKATEAEQAVGRVEQSVAGLETTVSNAQTAAQQAQQAAQTAETKANEAQQAAVNAQAAANISATAAGNAQEKAESAISKANTAKTAAEQAIADAQAAATTAAAAKLDAEQAQKDIDAFGKNLTTLENTMTAEYARKTDLTESEAHLQSQITQNAGLISSTVSMLTTIDETANDAESQVEKAQKRAEEARKQANQATADAEAAQNAADEAKQAAADAQAEADTAKTAADTARAVLDNAQAALDAAIADLETVQSRADATEEEIAAAQQAVEAAQQAANSAKANADAAAKTAAEAKAMADTAANDATEAQAAANTAASYAKIAQSVANESENAAAAQEAADDATEAAEEAQRTANSATQAAAEAKKAAQKAADDAAKAVADAEAADAEAVQAATDLVTAKQNLADVLADVDATEEEIAAAQQAVNSAQTAADVAMAKATEAAAHAARAKIDAAAAQTAADNAKAAADKAQEDATEAQKAADKAQEDVNALVVRVTTAETKITQNTEQIALRATKTEVAQTLGGYYTKEQTDSAITVKSNEITQTVSRTYATKQEVNDIEVGGCNLLRNSKGEFVSSTDSSYGYWSLANSTYTHGILMEVGQAYTLSFDWSVDWGDLDPMNYVYASVGCGATAGAFSYDIAQTVSLTSQGQTSGKAILTFTPTETQLDGRPYFSMRPIRVNTENALDGSLWTIKNLKLEKGNKATDWTPAPEDVAGDIAEAQNTANNAAESVATAESAIQQLADSIAQLVRDGNGGSLIRQDSNGLWYFNIGEIEKSISDTANELDGLSGVVLDANGKIDVLQSTAASLQKRTEYVRSYTDENGQPCLELGEGDSIFKVRITNTEIQFAEGTAIPAKLNRKMLVIEKAMVKDELQFGDDEVVDGVWIWKRRSNGNLGLSWKAVVR